MNTEKPHREGERGGNQEPREDGGALSLPPPSSSTSSPSHDFSFTISVLPSPIPSPNFITCSKTTTPSISMAPAPAPAPAKANDFFRGHLLPLHFLSYPPISSRPSDISIENISLPLGHLRGDASVKHRNHHGYSNTETKERTGLKSLSSFFGLGKWSKASNVGEEEENNKKKKKKVFDVIRFLKKYASMVEPLFFFKWEKEKRDHFRRPYSFSGHSNPKERAGWRRKRGEFSAPASMRTSPTNSGVLSMTCNPSDESTMVELQNAIEAAIAHCKNSAARKEE